MLYSGMVNASDLDPLPPQRDLPSGTTLKPGGEPFEIDREYKCYTVGEYSEVGRMVTDYRWLWLHASHQDLQFELKLEELNHLKTQVNIWKETAARADSATGHLNTLFEAEAEARKQVQRKSRWELWGWRVAAVIFAGSTIAFGTIGARK